MEVQGGQFFGSPVENDSMIVWLLECFDVFTANFHILHAVGFEVDCRSQSIQKVKK